MDKTNQFEFIVVGVAKEVAHNGAVETFGEIQVELIVLGQSVARVTGRNVGYH